MDYSDALEATLTVLRDVERNWAPAALANAFGPEAMVMTDLIARHGLDIEVFSIDTGRLPEETHALAHSVHRRYGPVITMVSPDPDEVRAWVRDHGQNGFYESVDLREGCCAVRKVAPLQRFLRGKRAWIAGLRREAQHHPPRPRGLGVRRGQRAAEVQPDARLDPRPGVGLHPRPRGALQRAVRQRATRASAAPRARGRSRPARTSAPAGGGGRSTPSRSAASTSTR
ncbi:phosphoadenosine phosphosulfate reductase family protein [Nocardioides sp. TF02-7]|uniref:phosphoadenosine phosphosulfate reductase domain-containing protein n=1 Tax=Nocardioides sp. TF02-7 TaxID=2917724 RepID=UPI001F0528C4|nr:phosphoadenosine phosphosulfate reductase family protein [Nocardioides sp. TF02-7]UMG93042.1 phosphoadenosine phosphosulfate reductase family protein [Nocardioides sp. TF02-7]